MQTPNEIDQRRRYWVLGLATLVVVAAVAAVVLVRGVGPFAGLAGAGEQDLPDQLSTRVVEVLEQASLSEAGGYGDPGAQGHPFTNVEGRIVCAAQAFGFDPPEATTIGEVETVYAHHMCAELAPELTWDRAIRAAGPLAVELTDPVTLVFPEQALPDAPEATYAERIRAIIPARYHEQALAPEAFTPPEVAEALRDRYQQARD